MADDAPRAVRPAAEDEPPIVFVSYSHDSDEHREWVAALSARLKGVGIRVILDQWHLNLGGDANRFMVKGITESDRVLVVCTPAYKRKAEEGEGGVGYENLIVTAEIADDVGTTKFIPILREGNRKGSIPIFLKTRFNANLTDGADQESEFDKLVAEIHQQPNPAEPPLGANPFAATPAGADAAVPAVPIQIADIPPAGELLAAPDAYEMAVDLAMSTDRRGWRKLTGRTWARAQTDLFEARAQFEDSRDASNEARAEIVDRAVEAISPFLCVALAGVESGRRDFRHQVSVIDNLLHIDDWNRGGRSTLIYLPETLAYIYQGVHGALCLHTQQISEAIELAGASVRLDNRLDYSPVWATRDLTGWPESLGRACSVAWKYLASAYHRWPWLGTMFDTELEYRRGLTAYYMALNALELSGRLAANGELPTLQEGQILELAVPLDFVQEPEPVQRSAFEALARMQGVSILWEYHGIPRTQIEERWAAWMEISKAWAVHIYFRELWRTLQEPLPHEALLQLVPN